MSQRSDFRFTERLRVRWVEVDMQKIVFNGHYLMYFDTAVGGYWRALAAPYAHVTAPLRRLVDRFANEVVLSHCAGTAVPEWTASALDELPRDMMRAQQRQRELDRAVHDLLEAVTLQPSIGKQFEARVSYRL